MLNFAINNEAIQGGVPIPLLTGNLIYKGYDVMANSQLSLFSDKCKIKGCHQFSKKRSMCYRHYTQVQRHGYTFGDPARTRLSPNTYRMDGPVTHIQMYDDYGIPTVSALIDTNKIFLVKDIKWRATKKGYVRGLVNVNDTPIEHGIHQVLLGIEVGNCKKDQIVVDHRNRNPLDNRLENLRIGAYAHNSRNSTKQTNTTSKYKGISWNKREKKWKGSIMKD